MRKKSAYGSVELIFSSKTLLGYYFLVSEFFFINFYFILIFSLLFFYRSYF